ncbi:MAG: transcription termination factor Rho [Caldithrix sp.]|nr:transcription termination factor Rho [Caldithrix sp.]
MVEGYLELYKRGFGFLRKIENNLKIGEKDIFVPPQLIQKYGLTEGLFIEGESQPNPENTKKSEQLRSILKINEMPVEEYQDTSSLRDQVSISPEDTLQATLDDKDRMGKILDMITPIGKGQRGLIVAAPKTGKTTILKHYAQAALQNHPDINVFVLLVDERPEEVTDFRRALPGAQVLYSSADESVNSHLRMTRLAMNVAIRQAEFGQDVFILIDSLTRMGRAFNKESESNGRTLSGGLGANALAMPRRFFGSARNLEGGGSLTILATILIDTGSRMDEIIFQEFKGTGNMELVLSKKCAEQRIFPAININASGTRKEELLMDARRFREIAKLRSFLSQMHEVEAMRYLNEQIKDKSLQSLVG